MGGRHPQLTMLTDWLEEISLRSGWNPEALAVQGTDSRLTRDGLVKSSTVLARQLQEHGIEPGDQVAVCLDRAPIALVAFVAVLRVGAVYLPIDPRYPAARLRRMFGFRPAAVVTTQSIQQTLPDLDCPVIFAEGIQPGSERITAEAPRLVSDEHPAYLMFTSGSTGVPNGVVVSRRALANYAASLREHLDISERDVYLHTASFAFSASIRQMVAPLAAGATSVIAEEPARSDPRELLKLMERHRVTVWDTVPSVWKLAGQMRSRARARGESLALPDTVRLILLTGEPLRWELVAEWQRQVSKSMRIISLYSQTETAGTVASFPIPEGEIPSHGNVPIGKPFGDVSLFVLDRDGNPVPAGEGEGSEGEIFVASDRLADGYADQEELTRKRFLSGLPALGEHRRVYRTGDFVRVDTDGALIPIGRRDQRVKIRGFRVDLLEIENELGGFAEVEQAVVLASEESRLVAFVVPAAGTHPLSAALQEALRERLPQYAVPSQVILVDKIPLTGNGKVDREALLRLRDHPDTVEQAAEPDPIEAELVAIWEDVLSYKGARGEDEFLSKGGDSLSAVGLFLEVEERFGVRLPPNTLLTSGTLRSLAARIRGASQAAPAPSILALREEGRLPPLFLVHAIWEHMPHFKDLVKLLEPGFPVYALEPMRIAEMSAGEWDAAELAKYYGREIRRLHPDGPVIVGGWSVGGFMAFCVAVEMQSRGDSPAGLLLIDASSPTLRPLLRPNIAGGLRGRVEQLRMLAKRQIESFQLPLAQQWTRLVWMVREAVRRLREPRDSRSKRGFWVRAEVRQRMDQYRSPPYQGSATLFRSQAPAVDPNLENDLGWSKHILGEIEIVNLPGDHVSAIIEPQNMSVLASRISGIVKRESAQEAARLKRVTSENQGVLDRFVVESSKLAGREFIERQPWINQVTRDSIRHFATAICDDNPLWMSDAETGTGPSPAPPGILVAARYPVLHGAPLDLPLLSLLSEIEYTWERTIHEGEQLRSSPQLGEVRDVTDPSGVRRIYVDSQTTYSNAGGEILGRARATVVRMLNHHSYEVPDWSVYRYSDEEREHIIDGIYAEARTGARRLGEHEFVEGTRLPAIVRGPLTIGDMVCWHSGVGPSYRPGPLGYKDALATPQFRVRHPVTGWPIKYMLQHEDVNLAHQRGMPAPFDNGVMRFAWVSPLLTNWIGDEGFLSKLRVKVNLPFFYGDTCWYTGEVTHRCKEEDSWRVQIALTGINQHGAVITTGGAEVLLPPA